MLGYNWWSRCKFWSSTYLGLHDVIRGHQQVWANNPRLKRARDMGVISLCLYCHDASTDMHHDLFGSAFDLRWPCPEVKYWPDLFKVSIHMVRRALTRGTRWYPIKAIAFLVKRLFAKKTMLAKKLFWGFVIPSAQTADVSSNLMACLRKTAQELSKFFSEPPN